MSNPPAFPRPASEYTASGTLPEGNDAVRAQDGMTLRDYFAAKALVGELSTQSIADGAWTSGKFPNLAQRCYAIADAMLAERNKPK